MDAKRWAMAGAATVLIGGAAAYYLRERISEQPSYRMRRSEGPFEVRDYDPLLVAAVSDRGGREDALRRGFARLAAYIFAHDRGEGAHRKEKIAMTAPVLQDEVGTDAGDAAKSIWRTRFVMPRKFTRASLPPPPAGVMIEEVPARRLAVLRFPGRATDRALLRREGELRHWLERKRLQPIGDFEYAFYNSPFVPPFLRRNEIWVPVAS